jgi:hypothetical protein
MCQGDMIAMKVADHNMGGCGPFMNNPLLNPLIDRHLEGVGKQSKSRVTQGHAWIDQYFASSRIHHTTEASNPQGFRCHNLDFHAGKYTSIALKMVHLESR